MKKKYLNFLKYTFAKDRRNLVGVGNKNNLILNEKVYMTHSRFSNNFCNDIGEKDEYFIHDFDFMEYFLSNYENKSNQIFKSKYACNENINDNGKIITIVLNNVLCKNSSKILNKSDILICADGGANRLYNLYKDIDSLENINNINNDKNEYLNCENIKINEAEKKLSNLFNKTIERDQELENEVSQVGKFFFLKNYPKILPDLICGDFDSININVYNFYKKNNVLFEKCTDQNNTDLDKCINKIKHYVKKNDKIFILGATGNRFDQTCANISSLYKKPLKNNLYLIGENNFLFLLKEGKHIININPNIFEKTCALLPIGNKCKIKTEGLKYNLNYEYLSFDKLISSSNEIIQTCIKISTNFPILYNCYLKDL
ncbi:thiamine pyrophosphokinase, putative [Plasmodium berghei]|uniref:Thiamine pyrophosphokinase, putative n=2 Tax=Plasmodium berghei TaxID=5821 RepID=A0A509AL56_PLABA|nr:thiamine pyrophosphokinase, putative [Plasmodium berghei ANKA]CXI34687.1 thiamine pyrophosphokinase, putative [Plasmodium berghei]SCM21413.1 thiamine pyrophosphokinase, putative [Plasmodium berghei]SCN24644.1 thiamine pyrophosphokinase, putative [Plasmodium berghei]SCO59804.1 thiamine pyrophosphokinase, putative [Plasmodium berghei]SCO61073.1 thiamine pyrophosphokinase, putative [Plasmodium berghei]|eukprot:XP_034421224.1 thiamine pyrophosphokinase, putative [Plasmodium berghei ANKA]